MVRITDKLCQHISILEKRCHKNEQYSRKECLELSVIPECVTDGDFKDTSG